MNKTQNYYEQNHKILIERYNSASVTSLNNLFNKHIKQEDKILEIGFGSGRDLHYIRTLGAECWGVDASQGFVNHLQKENYFKNRLFCAKLPVLELEFDIKFDVIVCIAVVMHLTKEELKEWVEDIENYLEVTGKVIVSYSTTLREDDERFFEDLRGDVLNQIFLDAGFTLIDEINSDDGLSRGIEWRSEVYRLVKNISYPLSLTL